MMQFQNNLQGTIPLEFYLIISLKSNVLVENLSLADTLFTNIEQLQDLKLLYIFGSG
jgi:hypothetical protein